jgi:hypothetical protein
VDPCNYVYIHNYICMHIYVIGVVSAFGLDSYLWRCRGGRIRWRGAIVAVLGRGGHGGGGIGIGLEATHGKVCNRAWPRGQNSDSVREWEWVGLVVHVPGVSHRPTWLQHVPERVHQVGRCRQSLGHA